MIEHFVTYPWVLYSGIPIVGIFTWYRLYHYKPITYRYALTHFLRSQEKHITMLARVPLLLRSITLLLLVILMARPRFIDKRHTVLMHGIDIILALDVSGSMQYFDDLNDQRSRIEIAKTEAMRFVARRPQDAIGLVLFGQGAFARCPLTADKKLLLSFIDEIELGIIDPRSTYLATGMVTAANRLKDSPARSKVLILLTDGAPMHDPLSVEQAIAVLKQYGIKAYTIGIGNPEGGFIYHPWAGVVRAADKAFNASLLQTIAQETGGVYFEAHKPQDLGRIYDQIDALEKTEKEAPLTVHYNEWFKPLLWTVVVLIMAELTALAGWWPLL